MSIISDAELADLLGIDAADVRARCLTGWPHLKPKRSVWRFTDEHVAEIIRLIERRRGSTALTAPLPGQTARSRARRRTP